MRSMCQIICAIARSSQLAVLSWEQSTQNSELYNKIQIGIGFYKKKSEIPVTLQQAQDKL